MLRPQRGVTLIELLVTMSILALMMLAAVPSLSTYIQNSRLRTTAESVLNGLQLARSEAVSRNTRVRFQLTSSVDNSCAPAATGTNWVINLDPDADANAVSGRCAADISETDAPRILQRRRAPDPNNNVVVEATGSTVVFNGLGRTVGAAAMTIDISNPTGGACAEAEGPMTCLRIVVSPGGQARMCNPIFPAGDPQAC